MRDDGTIGHAVSDHKACPKCGSKEYEVRNYDEMWRDGDVHCADCGTYIRMYDAG